MPHRPAYAARLGIAALRIDPVIRILPKLPKPQRQTLGIREAHLRDDAQHARRRNRRPVVVNRERHVFIPTRIEIVKVGAVIISFRENKMIRIDAANRRGELHVEFAQPVFFRLHIEHRLVQQIESADPHMTRVPTRDGRPHLREHGALRRVGKKRIVPRDLGRRTVHVEDRVHARTGTPREQVVEIHPVVVADLPRIRVVKQRVIERHAHRVEAERLDPVDVRLPDVVRPPSRIKARHIRIRTQHVVQRRRPRVMFEWRAGHVALVVKPVAEIHAAQRHRATVVHDQCTLPAEKSRRARDGSVDDQQRGEQKGEEGFGAQ